MDKKTLIAVIVSFGIFLAWERFYLKPQQSAQQVQTTTQQTLPQKADAKMVATGTPVPRQGAQQETKAILLNNGQADISNKISALSGWTLNQYLVGKKENGKKVSLTEVLRSSDQVFLGFDSPEYAYLNQTFGTFLRSDDPKRIATIYDDQNIKIVREASPDLTQTYLELTYAIEFKQTPPKHAFVYLEGAVNGDSSEIQDHHLAYWANQEYDYMLIKDDEPVTSIENGLKWVSLTSRYFVQVLAPSGAVQPKGLIQPLGENHKRISLVYPVSGSKLDFSVKTYFGPKEVDVLKRIDPSLDHVVDFGWFTIIAYPLLSIMKWFYGFVQNYGIAIILLTLLLKAVTFPLTYKSMKSMKQMSKLQPLLQKIKEKHKDDKEALNREMLSLMRNQGYNPMAGCFPILIQMPVFFALYRVLYSCVELYQAPFYFWIQDLSAKDPFYITPILLTVTMFIQQKLTPSTSMDPMQQKMIQFMPVIFGLFMLALPSGLTIYMLTNALAGIVQQLILNKKLDLGNGPAAVPTKAR